MPRGQSLRELLDRERIDPHAYGLDGPEGLPAGDRGERYFLAKTPQAGRSITGSAAFAVVSSCSIARGRHAAICLTCYAETGPRA